MPMISRFVQDNAGVIALAVGGSFPGSSVPRFNAYDITGFNIFNQHTPLSSSTDGVSDVLLADGSIEQHRTHVFPKPWRTRCYR